MNRFVLLLLVGIPLIGYSQATTTFWTNNCENFTGWTNSGTGSWGTSTYPYSGTYSYETNGGANYVNSTSYILVSPSIDISNYTECKLSFYAEINTEDSYDGAFIEASPDNGSTWIKLYNEVLSKQYDGKLPSNNILGTNLAWYNDFTWRQIIIDLKDFEDISTFKFRISFGSDNSNNDYGMNVDDFSIYGYAKTTIHNSGGTEQLVFDNSYLNTLEPTFRVSSDIAASFNRFKVEINKSPYLSDISHIQEFGGTYTGGTEYNLTCSQLNPPLTFTDNTTYYVRTAASDDNGLTWGKWSNIISFTWKPTVSATPQWFQNTSFQFNTSQLEGIECVNNQVDYKSTQSVSKIIESSANDTYVANTTYWENETYNRIGYNNSTSVTYTTGMRFTDIQIPKDATINKAFIVLDCYYPHNPGYGISNTVNLRLHAENSDNPTTYSSGSKPTDRSVIAQNVDWNLSSVWYDYSFYQTPEITTIVQALVNRAGWSAGNAMALQIRNNGSTSYREIRTIDSDPSHAAKLYIEYENTENGTITSPAIELASIFGATTWGRLFWEEEGTSGDFRITIQSWNGSAWVNTALTNLDYSSGGIDISCLAAEAQIRLVGTFTPSGGQAPTLKSWTVTTTQQNGNSDLTLSLNVDDLTPCISGNLEQTLIVANNGPDEASNIVIDFAIPAGLTLVTSSTSKGTYSSGSWIIPALQDGETVALQIVTCINADQGGNTINLNPSVSSLLQTDADVTNNSISLDIVVNNNSAPQIAAIADQQTAFNTAFTTINFTVTDSESDEDDLIYSASADDAFLIPTANFVFGGSGTNRTLDITPGEYQYGTTTVTITVDDGTCPATIEFDAQVVRHQFTDMEAASLVVGQPNFSSTSTTLNASYSPGASSCVVGARGHLAVGSQHSTVFQADNGRVMIWNSIPTANGTACNTVVGKSTVTSSTNGCTSSITKAVDGVAFSADGTKLLVSDAGNNRVLIWNTIPASTGQAADVVIGQSDFVTGTSGCSATKLSKPRGLTVSPDGKLFIVDGSNNRVLVFNSIPTVNGASADIVIGQDDFVSQTSGNSAKKLFNPWYCTVSTDGKLLISDTDNNRVVVFNAIPQQNGATADYVIGQEDFGISSSGLSANKFYSPIGVTVSPSGILAVGEFANHRVLIFNSVPQQNGASADKVIGQNNFTTAVEFNNGSGVSGTAANNNLNHPYNIFFDINDRLYVNGREMNRVLVFGSAPAQESDLSIAIVSDTDTPCMGNPVIYTIEVTNNGPDNSTNVVVNAALPNGFYYYEHSAERGSYSPAGGNWQIPKVDVGETISLAITGTVNYSMGGTTIETFASVRSNNQAETNYSNNSTSKSITITNNYAPTISRIADQQNNVGVATGIIAFTINDENGDLMTVTATSSNQTVVTNANITLGGSGDNRTVNITPEAGVHGNTTITISVTDGACTTKELFTASFGNLWIGKTTDWHTAANWAGEIPKTGTDVYIPSSPAGGFFPLISNNVVLRDLYLETGAALSANNPVTIQIERNISNNGIINIQNATTNLTGTTSITGTGTMQVHHLNISGATTCETTLQVAGTWNRTGTFTHSSGKVIFNGTAAQTIATAETFNSLGIDNSAGVTFSDDIDVADTLEITSGNATIGTTMTLANNITIVRTSGTLNSLPTFPATINIIYKGTVTTANEIPGTNTINNLEINGSGINVTLNDDLDVEGVLTLSNGILTTNGNLFEHSNTTAANLIGGNTSSFVNGTLIRHIGTNTDNYHFPIGNGVATTNYAPVTLLNNNLTGVSYLTASVNSITESGNNIDTNLSTDETGGNSYINVLENAIWTITPNAQPGGGTFGVQLYFNSAISAALSALDNQFGVLKRNTGSTTYADWDSFSGSTTIPANDTPGRTFAGGYAQRTGYTTFSEFAIASSEWPLPITLTNFSGEFLNGVVYLNWTTVSEYNNSYFVIERSVDAINFSEIGRMTGAGYSNKILQYSMQDSKISNKTYYYQLKQIDYDGKIDIVGLISVNCPLIQDILNLYPQPTENKLYAEIISELEGEIKISIFSMLGKNVYNKTIPLSQGKQTIEIDCMQLNQGIYIIHFTDSYKIHTQQFIKQ